MIKIKEIEPIFLDYKLRQDSSVNEKDALVSVLYEVTRAETPMLDGESLTWDSMLQACNLCQQDILDGAMFGYYDHQPKVFDKNGNAVGFYPDPEKRLFKVASMWPDDANKRILSWADYLDNDLGRRESRKIREDGFRPKVSMTSFVSCSSDGVCDVERIINYDQVAVPNMPSAVMLRFNSSEKVEKEFVSKLENYYLHQAKHSQSCCNNCEQGKPCEQGKQIVINQSIKPLSLNSLEPDLQNNSRSGKLIFYQNSSRTGANKMKVNFQSKFMQNKLSQHSAILSLEAVYGMALGGWLTQEGLIALKYWCDTLCELMEAKEPAATNVDASAATEATMMATDARELNRVLIDLNKTYEQNKKADSPSFTEVIKQDSKTIALAKPENTENPAITALANQISELSKIVGTLATDSRKTEEKAKSEEKPKDEKVVLSTDSKEDIQSHIDSLLANDVIKFGDLNYQRSSFKKEDIDQLRQNSLLADSKANAEKLLENGFALLSRHNANNFLNKKGFNMDSADLTAKGATTTKETSASSRYDQYMEAYLDNVAKTDYNRAKQIRQNMASPAYQEKVKPLKAMALKAADSRLKQINEYASTKGIRTDGAFDSNSAYEVIDRVLDVLPKGSGNRNQKLRQDASAPQVVDSTVNVILPTISTLSILAPVEDLDILMTLYSGLGSDSLSSAPPVGSPAFGRTFIFRQEYPSIATGNNDDPDNLELLVNNQGKNKLQEITGQGKTEEFVAKDYGALIRLARQHMMALLETNYDLVAMEQRGAIQKMSRDQVTRGIRQLFRRAGDANAKARTDTVANVAPSGSQAAGSRYYTGEYKKRSGAGVAINIAGKTYGGSGSNIDAVVRLLGGQTTNTAIQNTPVASFRTEYSATKSGALDTVVFNPVTVSIGGTDITANRGQLAYDSNGVSYLTTINGGNATVKWAPDEDGFILLASGAGHGPDPTSPQIVVTYYELTNCFWANINSSTDDQQKFWRDYIYNVADQNSILASKPNYARADMVLHDSIIGTQIRKAELFRNDSQLGQLELLSNDMSAVARYDWETHIATNATMPFGSGRSLMMKQNYGKMCSQVGQFGNWYQAQTVSGSDILTLDAICADIYMREVFGISLLTDANNQNKATGFPFKQIIHYGILKSQQ